MKFLVLGSAGFIGSAVTEKLLDNNHEVIGIDGFFDVLYPSEVKRKRIKTLNQHPNFKFIHRNLAVVPITDVLEDVKFVINEAAIPGLAPSWTHFKTYLESNTLLVQNIMESLKSYPDTHLVHASTSSVYGKNADTRVSNETIPYSPYGVSKLAAENIIHSYRENYGISATILRYFSVYGPNQRPDMAYAKICEKLLDEQIIQITGDGKQSRANAYIDDVVEATLLSCDITQDGQTFDVAGSEEIKLLDAVNVLSSTLNINPKIEFAPRPPGDQKNTFGNIERTFEAIGWRPKTPVRVGLVNQATIAKLNRPRSV